MPEFSDYVEGLDVATSSATVLIPASQAGDAKSFLWPYRGDWDPTGDVLPSSNVLAGYRYRLTEDYKGIAAGSTIEAAIDSPATDADWNFYVTTQL
jgi:hypothetical protein